MLAASTPAPPEVILEDTLSLLTFGARLDELVGDTLRWSSKGETAVRADQAPAELKPSVDSPDVTEASEETVETDESTDDDGVAGQDESTHAPAGLSTNAFKLPARLRSQSTFAGAVGQLVGIVVFGVIGLSLGYLILLWLQGPKGDILKMRDKLPRWITPGERDEEPPAHARSQSPQPSHETRGTPESFDAHAAAPGTDRPANGSIDPPGIEEQGASDLATSAAEEADRPLGPLQFAPHAPSELAAALSKVHATLGCEHCGGTGFVRQAAGRESAGAGPAGARRVRCEHCDGKPSGKFTVERFDELCDLAELVTFIRIERTEPDWDALRQEALRVLHRLGDDHDKAQIAGRLAGPRLDDSRRQSNGIVLAGTIHDAEPEGPLTRTRLVLFGRPRTVTVMSLAAPSPPLSAHDRVIILGSIIDSPRDNLGGYVGDLPQIVWGGLALKLD
ncbi:MAG TPA: hypothetical protein VGX76_11340 [Pirellulales bacterium]|nr:hypothetical protein [Pirellulales bacterium]